MQFCENDCIVQHHNLLHHAKSSLLLYFNYAAMRRSSNSTHMSHCHRPPSPVTTPHGPKKSTSEENVWLRGKGRINQLCQLSTMQLHSASAPAAYHLVSFTNPLAFKSGGQPVYIKPSKKLQKCHTFFSYFCSSFS